MIKKNKKTFQTLHKHIFFFFFFIFIRIHGSKLLSNMHFQGVKIQKNVSQNEIQFSW